MADTITQSARRGRSPLGMVAPYALFTLFALASAAAVAQPAPQSGGSGTNGTPLESPFKDLYVIVGATVTNDSNLFRRPAALAEADTITSGNIGLRLDKSWSQQQFQFDVTQTVSRYDRFKYLDFDAINYSGAWNWRLGKRFSGKLSASRSESLTPFEDTTGGGGNVRNVRISQNQAFDLDVWAYGGWHILMGVSQTEQTSEQNVPSRSPDFKASNANIGVKYLTRAGNSITAIRRTSDGEYTNSPIGAPNSDYTEDLSELSADWKLSGASSLNGRLGWLERSNKDPARRNFSGPSSSLNYTWAPGGKLSLTVSAARATTPIQDANASYRETDTLSLTPTWAISNKTSAFLRLNHSKDSDRGTVVVPPTGPRSDKTNSAAIGLDWAATRTLKINASVEHMQRSSNDTLTEYTATITRIGATLSF